MGFSKNILTEKFLVPPLPPEPEDVDYYYFIANYYFVLLLLSPAPPIHPSIIQSCICERCNRTWWVWTGGIEKKNNRKWNEPIPLYRKVNSNSGLLKICSSNSTILVQFQFNSNSELNWPQPCCLAYTTVLIGHQS